MVEWSVWSHYAGCILLCVLLFLPQLQGGQLISCFLSYANYSLDIWGNLWLSLAVLREIELASYMPRIAADEGRGGGGRVGPLLLLLGVIGLAATLTIVSK